MFNALVPQNVLTFDAIIISFANFDILPKDWILDQLGIELPEDENGEGEEERRRLQEEEEGDENFFKGLMVQILAGLGVLFVIFLMCLFYPFIMCDARLARIFYKIKVLIFWNSTLRIMMEGYM